jgi:hypothetical protein
LSHRDKSSLGWCKRVSISLAIHYAADAHQLIRDQVGYPTLETAEASLLFQVISQLYERQQPIVSTGNKAFADWSEVIASDPIMASAALGRLLHRSTVINMRGDSYRVKEKRKAGSPDPFPQRRLPLRVRTLAEFVHIAPLSSSYPIRSSSGLAGFLPKQISRFPLLRGANSHHRSGPIQSIEINTQPDGHFRLDWPSGIRR